MFYPPIPWLPVGSYPNVQSPWGLLDGSGSVSEWTESSRLADGHRIWRGSQQGGLLLDDRIDGALPEWDPTITNDGRGFRIASSIPAPGSVTIGVVALAGVHARRRRRCIDSAGGTGR